MSVNAKKKETLDGIFHSQGYTDYKWIDPTQIVVAQWVRMKCMFGCDEYGSLRLSHGTLIRKIQEERPCPTSPFKPANPWKRPPPKI
jgi:predicted metal-binding protein